MGLQQKIRLYSEEIRKLLPTAFHLGSQVSQLEALEEEIESQLVGYQKLVEDSKSKESLLRTEIEKLESGIGSYAPQTEKSFQMIKQFEEQVNELRETLESCKKKIGFPFPSLPFPFFFPFSLLTRSLNSRIGAKLQGKRAV